MIHRVRIPSPSPFKGEGGVRVNRENSSGVCTDDTPSTLRVPPSPGGGPPTSPLKGEVKRNLHPFTRHAGVRRPGLTLPKLINITRLAPRIPRRTMCHTLVALIVIIATLWSSRVQAGGVLQSQVDRQIATAALGSTSIGLLITDLQTGAELASVNPDKALAPASNMKLVTTAAALGILSRDFVYTTELRQMPSGDLVVRGSGDPAFGDPVILEGLHSDVNKFLATWVVAVKQTGLKKIPRLLVDDRVFDRQFVHPSWPTNQLHKWYCAQVAGIAFNDNCLTLFAAPGKSGATPSITIEPAKAPVQIDNQAVTGKTNGLWASRKLETNTFILRGSVQRSLTEPIDVTVNDPPLFFGGTLANLLRAEGIEVGSVERIAAQDPADGGKVIAVVTTPLPVVITRCNRNSQNLFAESLLKRLGYQITGQPGSWPTGAAAVRSYLAKVLGTSAADVVIEDGSGLSKENRISPRAFVKLLGHVHSNPATAQVYLASLAEPGEEGTLKKRFADLKIRGEIHAKTGYILGVNCLTGYLVEPDRTIAFSILTNDCKKSPWEVRQMMDKIIALTDAAYAPKKDKDEKTKTASAK